MESIMNMLKSQLTNQVARGVSDQLGLDESKAGAAVTTAIPLLLGALKNNASDENGASRLLGALDDPRHKGGGMLDSLHGVLGGQKIDDDVMDDGGKILSHIFGGKEDKAAETVGRSAGLNMETAMQVLKVVAPFVMSYLGRKTQEKNVSGSGDLQDLLGGLLGGQQGDAQNAASRVQDFDNNDSTVEDIAGMLLGGDASKGKGIGDMLGGFLGKK